MEKLQERMSRSLSLLRKRVCHDNGTYFIPTERSLTIQNVFYFNGVIPGPLFLNASISGLMLAKKSLVVLVGFHPIALVLSDLQ